MESKKVTVIVPVYNVEKYLEKCIVSICSQKYENLEIILVDDGSTDSSGSICDNYEILDSRIRVFHKKNGGLSDARNYALDRMSGDFVTFIDSDDYVDAEYVSLLMNAFTSESVDIAVCKWIDIDEEGAKLDNQSDFWGISGVYSKGEAFSIIQVAACGKLYKSCLFENIRYPLHRFHEDEFVFHHLISKADKVSIIDIGLYYYLQRKGSIMHTEDDKRISDVIDAFDDRFDFILKAGWEEVFDYTIQAYKGYVFKRCFNKNIPLYIRKKLWASWYKNSEAVHTIYRTEFEKICSRTMSGYKIYAFVKKIKNKIARLLKRK